jgi:hypothetical protein
MQLNKHVAKRKDGMEFCTITMHYHRHASDDKLDFGSGRNANTKCNEHQHKADKKTASRTQMQHGTFDIQHARKTTEKTAVEHAMEELQGRPKWKYLEGFDHSNGEQNDKSSGPFPPFFTGVQSKFSVHPLTEELLCHVRSEMKGKEKFEYDASTLQMIHTCFYKVSHLVSSLCVHTELVVYDPDCKNNRQVFRASPYKEGMPWNDWGMFDLSKPDTPNHRDYVPAQMKCFIDLTKLPADNDVYEPGMYCILEEAYYSPEPDEQFICKLWEPFIKKPHHELELSQEHCYSNIVNLNRLRAPCVVVPDLGNANPRAYLRMLPRREWADQFDDWLGLPHTRLYEADQFG